MSRSPEELRRDYEAALARQRNARALASRLRRKLVVEDRRTRAQRLIALGSIIETAAHADPALRESVRRVVAAAVVRDADRPLLASAGWLDSEPGDEPEAE